MNYTYDDIYGINIEDYLTRHGQTLADLKDKIQIDIQILKERQIEVHAMKLPYPDNYLENVLYAAIKKKQDHLDRVLDWANEKED